MRVIPMNGVVYKEGTEVDKPQQINACLLKIQAQNEANDRLKGQSMSTSLLKKGRMLGQLEHKEGTRMLCSDVGCVDCI